MADQESVPPLSKDTFNFSLKRSLQGQEYLNLYRESGRVRKVLGPIVEGTLPGATVGGLCRILNQDGRSSIEAEIVGFKDRTALLMPTSAVEGIKMGSRIEIERGVPQVLVSDQMIGKLLEGHGNPIDGEPFDAEKGTLRNIHTKALRPNERSAINERFITGVRALDIPMPLGRGQRTAVMAASGVGKSVLMGMISRHSEADVNVIALIGERGREVTEFIERDLGPEGMKKSVVVAVTSDESPVLRVRGAYTATAIAEYFRDQGKNVLFMMDSVTRFGMALREIGLAAGEPPTTKGYTPSVFSQLPRLLERIGNKKGAGSITGIYTVLVEGNDFDDPLVDAVRSILDGHIVLSRELAAKNHYPAIDVLNSVSRLSGDLMTAELKRLNADLRRNLDLYKSSEDLINIGGYRKGSNPELDRAIDLAPKINQLLVQDVGAHSTLEETQKRFSEVLDGDVQVPAGDS